MFLSYIIVIVVEALVILLCDFVIFMSIEFLLMFTFSFKLVRINLCTFVILIFVLIRLKS